MGIERQRGKTCICRETLEKHTSGPKGPVDFTGVIVRAEQAAEKGLMLASIYKKAWQGLKPGADFEALAARLKSCPDTKQGKDGAKMSFSAACKSPVDFTGVVVRAEALTNQSRPTARVGF
jgi:hypothetical protein